MVVTGPLNGDFPIADLSDINRGDIVRHKSSADSYVVTAHYGDRLTLVRTVELTNPSEWWLVKRET
jgi:hypothetical protein